MQVPHKENSLTKKVSIELLEKNLVCSLMKPRAFFPPLLSYNCIIKHRVKQAKRKLISKEKVLKASFLGW